MTLQQERDYDDQLIEVIRRWTEHVWPLMDTQPNHATAEFASTCLLVACARTLRRMEDEARRGPDRDTPRP